MGQMCHDKPTLSTFISQSKLAEDGIEQVFRCRFADDFANGVDGNAQFRQQNFFCFRALRLNLRGRKWP
jgi:hypothetical protein